MEFGNLSTLNNHKKSVFGLEYFFVDRHGMNIDTFRNPLLFRKDGKLTMQPRKVSYDLDGNAEIDKSDPEVRISKIYRERISEVRISKCIKLS